MALGPLSREVGSALPERLASGVGIDIPAEAAVCGLRLRGHKTRLSSVLRPVDRVAPNRADVVALSESGIHDGVERALLDAVLASQTERALADTLKPPRHVSLSLGQFWLGIHNKPLSGVPFW